MELRDPAEPTAEEVSLSSIVRKPAPVRVPRIRPALIVQ